MASKDTKFSIRLLSIAVALFFFATGLMAIIDYDSAGAQFARSVGAIFGQNYTLTLVIAIVQMVIGLILLIDVFLSVKESVLQLLKLIIFIAWAVYIVYAHFLSNIFEPTFFAWLQPLSQDLVVLGALWLVSRETV